MPMISLTRVTTIIVAICICPFVDWPEPECVYLLYLLKYSYKVNKRNGLKLQGTFANFSEIIIYKNSPY